MFLAAATLVTSAGLSSGLTSLAETVTKNAEVSARSNLRVASPASPSEITPTPTEKPSQTPGTTQTPGATQTPDATITPGAGEVKVDIKDEVKNQGVTNVIADESMNLTIEVADEVSDEAVKTQTAFVNWLKDTVIKTVSTILSGVDLDTVDHNTVKQFDIKADAAGSIKMEFEKDYVDQFVGKTPVVLHKHGNTWERIKGARFRGRVLEFKMDNFSPVIIFAAEEDKSATPSIPSRGSSSTRGSNSSSGKATVTNEVNTTTLTGTWKRDAKGWWFQTTGGGYPRNRWGIINGKWFFFGNDGYMKTGWVQSNGAWYYCNPDANNGTEGEMKTGWIVDNGKWFYLGRTGAMETGWVQVNGVYYYLNPVSDGSRGAMAVNTWIGNYYVGADGAWQQNRTR